MVIVALDVGQARIGVAVSDELELLATPHSTIRRTSNAAAIAAIARVVDASGAQQVVVGLPVSFDGEIHTQAQSVQAFAGKLRARLSVPLVYADETLSTVRAEEQLRAAGVRPDRIRERIDAAAAAVILQEYLDARHQERTRQAQPPASPPPSDVDDSHSRASEP
ncbi:MAG: Holliday junction resolvase RuvX [Ktedonobacterales bacterium]